MKTKCKFAALALQTFPGPGRGDPCAGPTCRTAARPGADRGARRRPGVCFERIEPRLLASGTPLTDLGLLGMGPALPALVSTTAYAQTNLVADVSGAAATTDSNLINPWGVAYSPFGPFWVANNNSGTSTLYDGNGASQGLVVSIPAPGGGSGGTPTGIVYNPTAGFTINGTPSVFIFATEDGTIAGWATGTQAMIAVDNSAGGAANGAVYKGLALGTSGGATYLYAANFRSAHIDVFNQTFQATTLTGSFTDPDPSVATNGFAPFDVQNIGGNLYVTYAQQDAAKHDSVAGAGSGIVDEFDTSGNFVRRVASGGTLNAPWGMTMAPTDFGPFGGDLLVGNFGDGRINAFDPTTGTYLGQVSDASGNPIVNPGLWSLIFGNGSGAGSTGTLFFTAGGATEQHGLFGTLTTVTAAAISTSTNLVSSALSVGVGTPVTFTATVSASSGTATGLVTFADGATVLGTVPLDATGQAALTTSSLIMGTHSITATYAGSGIVAGSTSNTLTQMVTLHSHAENQAYVMQLYRDILHREADASGLTAWTAVLDGGGTFSAVATAIVNSAEHFTLLVEGYYASFLHRQADAAGLNYWVSQLLGGATLGAVRAGILGSDEFFNDAGGTNSGFVTAVYQDLLGRDPDPFGLGLWTGLITSDPQSRFAVASGIDGSDEHLTDIVIAFYLALLHRAPDAAGLATWVGNLRTGATELQVTVDFVTSGEYLANLGIATPTPV